MMKKLLVLLLSAMMVFSLVACGGEDTPNYTAEQTVVVDAYEKMLEDYQGAIDLANKTPELANDKEFAEFMNEVTDSINELTELIADPANLTTEVMAEVNVVIENAYVIINRIEAYAELLPILTIAGIGTDAEKNTYWFALNEDETVGAMVILSADEKEHAYCIGEMTVDAKGVYTINDEDGYTMSMTFQVVDDDIIVTLQDGTRVDMVGATPREVVEAILSIQENTQNVNP